MILNDVWLNCLDEILFMGEVVAPRGQRTLELMQHTSLIEMRSPVLTVPGRKLSYAFMAASAYWILTGDETVAGIAPWNKHIAQYSDNGETFFGAYGPRIAEQIRYVITALTKDQATRQAVMTLWRPNPPESKDIPCTVAITFNIRNGRLNCCVFMRSSDVWLGMPYDVFDFSCLAYLVRAELAILGVYVELGHLALTAASCHLYEQHWEAAKACLAGNDAFGRECPDVPWSILTISSTIMNDLHALRDTKKGDPRRWWEQ